MRIELTADEASLLIGIISAWMTHTLHSKWEHDIALRITDKILEEDRKAVDKVSGVI